MDSASAAAVEAYYGDHYARFGLQLAKSEQRGRHLVSTRDVARPGTEVYAVDEPYCWVVDAQHAQSHCGFCCQPHQKLSRCGHCKQLRYCSVTCQSVAPHKPTTSMLLMWRLLLRRVKEEGQNMPNFSLVRYLTSHTEEFSDEQKEKFGLMAAMVYKSLPEEDQQKVTPQEIMSLFCMFVCNNLTINDGEMKPLGVGLYPSAALLNHSCDPNCIIIFEGRRVAVRSVKPIRAGEELTINYIEIGDSTEKRRQELKEHFFFDCDCPRCTSNLPRVTPVSGDLPRAQLEAAEKCKAEGLECKTKGDFINAKKLLLRTLHIEKDLLEPRDPRLASVLNELMDVAIATNVWNEALYYCHMTLEPFEAIYPQNWPLVGLQYFVYGKLQFYLRNTESALQSLQKALEILLVTHGQDHSLVRQLKNMLGEVEAEYNYEKREQNRPPRQRLTAHTS